jgi:hypothetical protein
MALLGAAGLPVPAVESAADADAAAAAAARLGFPVALKIRSRDVAHKSDVGGVHLALDSAAAVRQAFREAMASVRSARPTARIDGVLVSPMARDGLDMILGVTRDPLFGPVLMVGLGGVFVEVLRDVSLARAPVDAAQCLAMLRRLRAWPLLAGARGAAKADVAALCEAMATLSRFAVANRDAVASVDVNPFRVFGEGEGACMLDALIELRAPGA